MIRSETRNKADTVSTNTRELRAKLRAAHGDNIRTYDVPRLGLIAIRRAKHEEFIEFLTAVFSPHESTGKARELLIAEALVHPTEPSEVAKVRRFLSAMPQLATDVSRGVEVLSAVDFEDYNPTEEEAKELDKKYEFGWSCLDIKGHKRVTLATNETAGAVARSAIDSMQTGTLKSASVVQSAILAFVEDDARASLDALMTEYPGLIAPLWLRCYELAGLGVAEMGKD